MIFILFFLNFLTYPFQVLSQDLYVKHNQTVIIYNLVVNKNGNAFRDDSMSANYTRFTIQKYPYYKSPKDYIMGGKTVLFIRNSINNNNKYCAFNGQKLFVCLSTKPSTYTMRILGKHDKDNEPLYDLQEIKFRIPNSTIDCAAAPKKSFSCVKQEIIKYYTFILAKDF